MALLKKENEGIVKALALTTLVLPFIFSTGLQGVRYTQMLAFILIASGFLAWKLASEVSLSAGFFYLTGAFSAVYAGFGEVHAVTLVFFTAGALIIYFSKNLKFEKVRPLLLLLAVTGVLQSLYGYLQIFGFDPIFERVQTADNWIPVGTLGQQTLYGPFLAAALSAALIVRPVLAFIIFPAILLTMSVMTYASLAAVLFIYGTHRFGRKFSLISVATVILMGGLYILFADTHEFFDPHGRFMVWKKAFVLYKKHIFLGWGLGSYKVIAPLNVPTGITEANGFFLQAHNDYLQTLFELGLLGVLGLFWAIYDFARAAWTFKSLPEAVALIGVFAAIAVNAIANFPMHVAPLAFLALVSWSIIVSNKRQV